jgi:XTP/dITP diphosphohydrolase
MQLLFASSNVNKLNEIREMLPNGYDLISLSDKNFTEELQETGETLEENALQKAWFVYEKFKINCFSDDSGLEVTALNNDPGVNSAFYAGLPRNDQENMKLVLHKMKNESTRTARFKTIIALIFNGKEYLFEGVLDGRIGLEMAGEAGFGYDPVFIPEGYSVTLAEGGLALKNRISHRKKALNKLVLFLNDHLRKA